MGLFHLILATCGLALASAIESNETVAAIESNQTVQAEGVTTLAKSNKTSAQWKPMAIAHGTGYWSGQIKIVNNLPAVCPYSQNSATWFSPNGRGDLVQGQSVDLGPFWGWYTLGVQENVFANCAYPG
ncbi:hypothetical protein SDRG_17314, partial [Saprolegnia diclina VS20]